MMGIFIFIFLGLICLVAINQKMHNQNNYWISWQKLAKANKLAFSPSNFFDEVEVFGKYKGHYLRLETIQKDSNWTGPTYTRLMVQVIHPHGGARKAPLNVEDVTRLFTPDELEHKIWGIVRTISSGRVISYEQLGIETNPKYLQFLFDWLSDIADAYPAIVTLGGETVPLLRYVAEQNSNLEPLVNQLLYDIANKTSRRLGHRVNNLICPGCLTFCGKHKVKLNLWKSITYYGCRTCHQSREFFEGWVVARLDNTMTQEQVQQDGILRINWLSRRTLFDFDEVEIVQATDEEVERFAVQVGNDTDFLRKPRYQQMRCVVSAHCGLSENSHRILRRMFGSVEVRETEFNPEMAHQVVRNS